MQTARLSLASRLMVQFASQPLAVSSLGDGTPTQFDPGDLVAGVQAITLQEHGHAPAVALGYQRRLRAGTAPDIDIGGFSQSAILFVSGDLRGFHYDSNFLISEQQGGPVRRAQFGQTLSVSHNIFAAPTHDALSLSGEIWHFTQPLVDSTRDGAPSPRSNAVGTLWALAWTVRPNLVLDAGFDRGLTSTSTAWQGFAGFTYLLPHRLWPQR